MPKENFPPSPCVCLCAKNRQNTTATAYSVPKRKKSERMKRKWKGAYMLRAKRYTSGIGVSSTFIEENFFALASHGLGGRERTHTAYTNIRERGEYVWIWWHAKRLVLPSLSLFSLFFLFRCDEFSFCRFCAFFKKKKKTAIAASTRVVNTTLNWS